MREAHKTNTQLQLIEAIKANDQIALKQFYMSNYHKIEALVLKNSGSIDHAKDLYQDSFIAVWKNLKANKFEPKNETALQGYLYQIAKNKWMDTLRSRTFKKTNGLTDETLAKLKEKPVDDEIDTNESDLNTTMNAFKNLGQPCKQLLTNFYYEKKSLRVIASELQLEEASVRNKKYRCMEKLRNIVLSSKS
ncbi:RNA polymerase sigma factor [Psychroserpens mesophilus]|uniref:RNA polymerase sigma factor n=1 Tax=Psychroserpens mesophilus TaxID=325473 RepID=UPI0005908AAF|nr:sigma-70 family RNA polymerase sigma factor [Psychroserpens mesophilus]